MTKLFIDHFFTLMAYKNDDLKTKYIKNNFKVQGLAVPKFEKCKRNIKKADEQSTNIVKFKDTERTVDKHIVKFKDTERTVDKQPYNQIDLRIKTFEFLLENNNKLKITKLGKRMAEEMSSLYLLEALDTIKDKNKCIEKIQEYSKIDYRSAERLYNRLHEKIHIQKETMNTNTSVEMNSQEEKKADNNINNHFAINDDDDFDVDEYKVVDNKSQKLEENDNTKQIPAYRWIYNTLKLEAYHSNDKTASKTAIKNLVKGDKTLEKLYSDFTKGFATNYQQKFKDKQDVKKQADVIVQKMTNSDELNFHQNTNINNTKKQSFKIGK
jgi:hypothetical protein